MQSYLEIFKGKKANKNKLLKYGFLLKDGLYILKTDILNGQMQAHVSVKDDFVDVFVFDNQTQEEYVLYRFVDVQGEFVGLVRQSLTNILQDVCLNCFDDNTYINEQTINLIKYCKSTFGTNLEFLWKDSPTFGVLRREDTKKWYGVIMKIPFNKLGLNKKGETEVVNLHLKAEQVSLITDNENVFPAYHMNKKYWVTIILNGNMLDDNLFDLIEKSYYLAKKTSC